PNYLLAIARQGLSAGLCWVDVSTGACEHAVFALDEPAPCIAFIQPLAPAEVIAPAGDALPEFEALSPRALDVDWTLDAAAEVVRRRFSECVDLRPDVV